MASMAANDWRAGKNLLMCNKYMLEKNINSDISLVVGRVQTIIPAHKYVLISRSSVFCTKLISQNPVTQLHVPDVEPDIFQILLHYMYYENINIAQDKALETMTAALKYEIHGLVDHCIGTVNSRKTPENICVILKYAFRNPDSGIKNSALDYFFENAQSAMNSSAFKDLPRGCLMELIESSRLNIPAEKFYEGLMLWASAECARSNLSDTDANRRKVLEPDIFPKIKFENMDMAYFASISNTGLLKDAEKIEKFQKISMRLSASSSTCLPTTPSQSTQQSSSSETIPKAQGSSQYENNFSRSLLSSSDSLSETSRSSAASGSHRPRVLPPRTSDPYSTAVGTSSTPDIPNASLRNIQRFEGILSGKSYMRDNHDGISLMVSQKVKLHGVYVYGSHQTRGKYQVTLKVLEDVISPNGATLSQARPIKFIPNKTLDTDGQQKQYLIKVDPPAILKPDVLYTLDLLMKGPVSYYGRTGREYVLDDDTGVSVTFIPYELALGGTNTDIGQLPGIQIEMCDF